MPVIDEAGVGIRMGSTESVGGRGCHFGVACNAEQMWLVMGVEANPVVNMMASYQCRVQKMGGDLGDGGLLGSTMAGMDGMAGVEGTVGMRVVSESSP